MPASSGIQELHRCGNLGRRSAGGAAKAIKTTPLMTLEEGMELMRKAGASGYRSPGGWGHIEDAQRNHSRKLFHVRRKQGHTKGNINVVDEIFATDFIFHSDTGDERDPEGVKRRITRFRTAFPDIQATIEDQIAKGNKVVTRVTWRGTHRGEFRGTAATNKQVEWTGTVIQRIAGGKIVERWGNLNTRHPATNWRRSHLSVTCLRWIFT